MVLELPADMALSCGGGYENILQNITQNARAIVTEWRVLPEMAALARPCHCLVPGILALANGSEWIAVKAMRNGWAGRTRATSFPLFNRGLEIRYAAAAGDGIQWILAAAAVRCAYGQCAIKKGSSLIAGTSFLACVAVSPA